MEVSQHSQHLAEGNKITKAGYSLGCNAGYEYAEFRIFCERANSIEVEIFEKYEDKKGRIFSMNKNGDGIWQLTIKGNYVGKYYGYRITPPANEPGISPKIFPIADPYSKLVTTKNHHLQFPKSLIVIPEEFDWENDTFVIPEDPRDLVIYETHLKDLTADVSSGCSSPGTYLGFIENDIIGGIEHLKKLGVNAVEFLPLQKFAYFEPPHNEPISDGVINTWNFYGRNYWGYMTSFFFVPETMFASDGTIEPDELNGCSQKAITEFKMLVRELHKHGISVIMDVVYNHTSQYDLSPFKYIDRDYYYRLNGDNQYLSESGCGNDFRTESKMARKLIVESIIYWMKEFHVDGFRFDLANLIDRETLIEIRDEARKVNPNVLLIGEPWGGGYNPTGFSEIDWPSWNDQIRNGVKGSDPRGAAGFIFGRWQGEVSREGLENTMRGTLLGRHNGRYHTARHSVNYLESHDGYTLGDFIRIGLNHEFAYKKHNRDELAELSEDQLQISKLAAIYLFSCQGITMIHAGQEWSRAKVVEPIKGIEDPYVGHLDHNSYEKDNATNYLNFDHLNKNISLFNYYKGLINLRLASPALRKSPPEAIHFWSYHDSFHITCGIQGEFTDDPYDYIISLNGNRNAVHKIMLPEGVWEIVASGDLVTPNGFDIAANELLIHPSSGYILRKLRNKD
jgi:pullulanase/glycogen debranching enzyme